jgi:hypothetical protein
MMLPLDILWYLRQFCDIDTKIALYKSGILPMNKIQKNKPLPMPPLPQESTHDMALLKIKLGKKHMWVLKQWNTTPYIIQTFDTLGYFEEQTGLYDKKGSYLWIETIPVF